MKIRNESISIVFFLLLLGIGSVFVILASCGMVASDPSEYARPLIHVRNLPPSVSSIVLTISGEGMDTISREIDTSETSITLDVPAGSDRLFELDIAPGAESVFLGFYGSETVSLTAGETTDITISLELTGTRIVLPDAEHHDSAGGRIVQIDDMTGAGWKELDGLDLGFGDTNSFIPYDIDYDNQGRIYIANSANGVPAVMRLNSIQDTSYEVIVTDSDISTVNVLTVDRVNNYIYYSDGFSPIYRKSLGPPLDSQEVFDINNDMSLGNFQTFGFAVDSDGILYVTDSMNNAVHKYNPALPSAQRGMGTYTANLNDPRDALVFGDNIVISNKNGTDGYKVIVLDKNLSPVNHFGTNPLDDSNPTNNEYSGPEQFVAILNKKITIINEGDQMPSSDQLIQIDDIYGNGWTKYGSVGTGTGQFYFFSRH